jgi:REP element-mobilizing transposase RayT
MPGEGKRWRHVVISTLNSWLPGSPRGFRAVDHKIHSSGDYKNPPPPGEHAGLHRYSKKISGEPVVLPEELRRLIGRVIVDELYRLGHRILAIAVAATHCHILVELPDDMKEIRRIVGECKRKASVEVKKQLPGRVWAHDGKYGKVDSADHQRNTYRYILNQEDAWVWSYKMLEAKKESDQAPP